MKLNARVVALTVSDRSATGAREDRSGPLIEEWAGKLGADLVAYEIIPDDRATIAARLIHWSERSDLILTTGGTGLAPRDVTPEATLEVIDRSVPGIPEWIRASTGAGNRFAYLSRGVAGLRGTALIVNLPGSPRAVAEYLDHLEKILPHSLEQLTVTPGSKAADRHPESPNAKDK